MKDFTGFVAGTLVHTKSGLVPIEQLKVGDLVLSQPDEGGALAFKPVTETHSADGVEVWLVEYFLLDEEHPRYLIAGDGTSFWLEEQGWVRVDELEVGSDFQLNDGEPAVLYKIRKILNTETPNVGWTSDDAESKGPLIDLREGKVDITPFDDEVFNAEAFDIPNNYFCGLVYDIKVEDFQTYYVGEAGVWVHSDH